MILTMAEEEYTTHLFEYQFEGARWTFDIPARSREDAEARLNAMGWATWLGSHAESFPAHSGWWVKLLCWRRNRKRKP